MPGTLNPAATRSAISVRLAIACCALFVGCGDYDNGPAYSSRSQAVRIEQLLTGPHGTSAVAALSEQIAAEVNCITPDLLVRLQPNNNLTFHSRAVLGWMPQPARAALLAALAERPHQTLTLNSAFRTVAQQYLLKAWDPGSAAAVGESNHESGRAIDVADPASWKSTLERHGWLQNVAGDEIHFEHLASPDLRRYEVRAFQRLWNRNHPNDPLFVDGIVGEQTLTRIGLAPAEGFAIGACATTLPNRDAAPPDRDSGGRPLDSGVESDSTTRNTPDADPPPPPALSGCSAAGATTTPPPLLVLLLTWLIDDRRAKPIVHNNVTDQRGQRKRS
ncbi:MAG: hypothetical protein H6707_06735 [Deltaproteobacteria bacterium]|nr:hypothetical protein [Deltaproteobacteria bacterium]